MEQNQDTSLFGLSIDQDSKAHLAEAARWGKFLAIVGFIMCGLIIVFGIFFGSMFGTMSNRYGRYEDLPMNTNGLGAMMAIIYVIIAVVYFFPCLFLFRFANKMKNALATNTQNTLNSSFQNLKALFRYMGVITIIVLIIYALSLIVILLSAGSR